MIKAIIIVTETGKGAAFQPQIRYVCMTHQVYVIAPIKWSRGKWVQRSLYLTPFCCDSWLHRDIDSFVNVI